MPAPAQRFFDYLSFQDPNTEIRLLELDKERPNGHLQARLSNLPLSSCKPFVALSYEWGEPGALGHIEVNGKTFNVQENLHLFLQRIHAAGIDDFPVTIWVDAICINQYPVHSADPEKSAQVKLMSRIYSQAQCVYVWLGEHPSSSIACELLHHWSKDEVTRKNLQAWRECYMSSLSDVDYERQIAQGGTAMQKIVPCPDDANTRATRCSPRPQLMCSPATARTLHSLLHLHLLLTRYPL